MNTNEPTLLDVIDGDRSKRYLMLAPFGIGVRLRSAGIDPDMPVTRLRADLAIADAVERAGGHSFPDDRYNAGWQDCLAFILGDDPKRCNCGYGGYHEPLNERCVLNQRVDA